MRFARPFAAASPLVLGLLLAAACGHEAAPTPTWPEQPTPAYPSAKAPVATTSAAPAAERPEPAPPSLAKEYSSQSALSVLTGKASYYADSLGGHRTANGEIYDPGAYTAAHKKLPFGTIVRVIRTDTGATTYAKINDRGPFGPANRIIDLSGAAADQLQMRKAGVVSVRVEVLTKPRAK